MSTTDSKASARVLIVDDEDDQRSGLASLVSSWGHEVRTARDGQDALEKLADFRAHVMLTDLTMPRMDGKELLRRLAIEGGPVSIVLTAFGSIENAIETVHDLGAFWFIEKPVRGAELKTLLARAVSQGLLREERESLTRELSYRGRLDDLVGRSKAMQEIFSLIRQVAPSRAAVLVTGESGVGKELVARAIHNLSPRQQSGRFVAINCAALPESLIESELFGHEKGAFTGALQRRQGCFEMAEGGTLLLDEIGDMPIGTQAKLLRVLEDSRVRRLGGDKEIQVDVRIVAATNKKIEEAVGEGELREDLFYRLNVFHIHLPPLRARKDDILPIAEALIESQNKKHDCKIVDIHPEALQLLELHSWPGNVRELRNVLERAVILAGEGTILPAHLLGLDADNQRPAAAADPDAIALRVGTTVREGEKALILKTLEYTGNNKTQAAKILEVSLKTLHNKLKEYGS